MSEKYSDNTFFFANYGCCIPTESYAWILVALFVTTVLVLLVCMLATATIRWMYKRRMRKRLHDLKRKFLMDQLNAQEFEAKLNYMAQRNKSCQNNDGSREEPQPEKLTIFVDPAQKEAEKHLNSGKNKKKNSSLQKPVVGGPSHGPIYDRDETPIAQSTLASQSNTNAKMRNENRWMYLPKSAQAKAPVKTLSDDTTPIPTPQIPQKAPPPQTQAPPPLAQAPPPPPPHLGSYYDLPPNMTAPPKLKSSPPKNQVDMGGNSPIIPLDPTDVSPEVTKKDALAPPTSSVPTSSGPTSSGVSSGTLTSSGTSPGIPSSSGTSYTTPPDTTPTGTSDSSFTTPLTTSNATSPKLTTSPGEGVKQNVQYGQDDIVSPLGPPETGEPKNLENGEKRKDGAGGRSEWKYYNLESSKKKRGGITTMSTTTKSSTSNRRSTTGSWLFDSTGSNRFDSSGPPSGPSARTNSTVSNSILKTDSSYYKTASLEQFPHGAFTFQSN